jgi:hypothetical protein
LSSDFTGLANNKRRKEALAERGIYFAKLCEFVNLWNGREVPSGFVDVWLRTTGLYSTLILNGTGPLEAALVKGTVSLHYYCASGRRASSTKEFTLTSLLHVLQ